MGAFLSVPFFTFHTPMATTAATASSSPPPHQPSSPPPPPSSSRTPHPTHIPLPPPPSFSAFLSTPSPSQRDDPFAEDVSSPYLQFFTAPSTPYSESDQPMPSTPPAEYFTPPSSPFCEVPTAATASVSVNVSVSAPTAVPLPPLPPPPTSPPLTPPSSSSSSSTGLALAPVPAPVPVPAAEPERSELQPLSAIKTEASPRQPSSALPPVKFHPAHTYVSPSPYGTDDTYPVTIDVVSDLILDDGSLTPLEKIYLFSRSRQSLHRNFIAQKLPVLLQHVTAQEAVEYILPLFHELVCDSDESVLEDFARSLGEVMWWFLTRCQMVPDSDWVDDGTRFLPAGQDGRIRPQTFTPLFGTLLLSSNGNVSEGARCSLTTVLDRIKLVDDKEILARGEKLPRPPLSPDNLWQPPAQDYAIDDPEIPEQDPEVGSFGPKERALVKEELIGTLVVFIGRLDIPEEELEMDFDQLGNLPAEGMEDRRAWLEGQNDDGVQVISPADQTHRSASGVLGSDNIESPDSANMVPKENNVNPYFPVVPNSYSIPSSLSSTPSTPSAGNSSGSSSSSPSLLAGAHATASASVNTTTSSSGNQAADPPGISPTPDTMSGSRSSQETVTGSQPVTSDVRHQETDTTHLVASIQRDLAHSVVEEPRHPSRKVSFRPNGPITFQPKPGNWIHEEEENVYYDEQPTNGRWSSMRLISAIAANGSADLEWEIFFIGEVERATRDPVYWVRREAAFAIGALARVVPAGYVLNELVPMFEHLVLDPHYDVRQNVLFALPALVRRLPYENRKDVAMWTLTTLAEDRLSNVRGSTLDTLAETIHTFIDDPEGPPPHLMHMFLGRKDDKNVRSGTRLITFDVPPPLEAFYLDTKRPLTLAFGYPAVALTLGPSRWDELRDAYLDLSVNRMNDVKRSLAAGLGELARIIGREHARRDLVGVWWNSINSKDQDTRIRAVESMEGLIGVVGNDLGLEFWGGVLKNWESGILKGWRERNSILRAFAKAVEMLGHEVLPIVKGLEAHALRDNAAGVRDTAISILPGTLRLLDPRKEFVDDLNKEVTELGVSHLYRRRMTYVSCQTSIFLASVKDGRLPSEALGDEMLRSVSALVDDQIEGVRICVARFAGSVCDKFVRESEPIPDGLADLVRHLAADNAREVKHYTPDPTTFLSEHVPPPLSTPMEEVPEANSTLPTPRRSRHMSKPPVLVRSVLDSELSGHKSSGSASAKEGLSAQESAGETKMDVDSCSQ